MRFIFLRLPDVNCPVFVLLFLLILPSSAWAGFLVGSVCIPDAPTAISTYTALYPQVNGNTFTTVSGVALDPVTGFINFTVSNTNLVSGINQTYAGSLSSCNTSTVTASSVAVRVPVLNNFGDISVQDLLVYFFMCLCFFIGLNSGLKR